jgi:hypothetical protein
MLHCLPHDGNDAIRELLKDAPDMHVVRRGTNKPRSLRLNSGQARDERQGDDYVNRIEKPGAPQNQKTAPFHDFLRGGRGAVHRIESEGGLLKVIPVPDIANNTLLVPCKQELSVGLQVRLP